MRRITVFLPGSALCPAGLTGLAAAQNVSIQLTLQACPSRFLLGRQFQLHHCRTNNATTPQQAAVWVHGHFAQWQSLRAGFGTGNYHAESRPDAGAFENAECAGWRTQWKLLLYAYIGIYPDSIWAADEFSFEKLSAQPGGTELWVARLNGPANNYDNARALALADDGSTYVTGSSYSLGSGYDYVTVKYDGFGNQIWVTRYAPPNSSDYATSIALDDDGNVCVTGWSTGFGTLEDYATVKYDASGNQIWNRITTD